MKAKHLMKPIECQEYFSGVHAETDIFTDDILTSVTEGMIYVLDDNKRTIGVIQKSMVDYVRNMVDQTVLSEVMNLVDDGIVAIAPDGKIFYANEAYSDILGISINKIIGKFMQDIEPKALLVSVLNDPRVVTKSKQYIASLKKYVSLKIAPIYKNGKFIALVSVFSDATEIVRLNHEVERVHEIARQFKEEADMQKQLDAQNIIGSSAVFMNAVSKAMIASKTDAIILLRGENGVGKEVFARMIHSNSIRQKKPMITVNCAAIPENLIESELFGYEEGTFTGAKLGGKKGKFELADGGTLFLDEIGDMPFMMQSKLLRVLETNEIEKIGSKGNVTVDTRIIAATNQPLEQLIEEKKFRKDLYYRINLIEIEIPPLRMRKEDIQPLVEYFLTRFNQKYQKEIVMSVSMINEILAYDWPGNVRELQNFIQYGVIMGKDDKFEMRHTHQQMTDNLPATTIQPIYTLKEAVDQFENDYIKSMLESVNQNRTIAMEKLGISRRTFYRKLSNIE